MSTADALAQAILALAPAGTVLGEVPSSLGLPWRSMTVTLPGVADRSEATPAHGYRVRVRVLVTAATQQGAHLVGWQVSEALEGARPVADGWLCGPLLSMGSSEPYMADVVLNASSKRVVCVPLSFELTASRLP